MDRHVQKQLIIGIVFIFIFSLIGYGIYYSLAPKVSCTDSIKNGKEEGVDCGTLACGFACQEPVQPLKILTQKLIEVRPGDYDFVVQILNPNSNYGSSRVDYVISEFNHSGSTYILPGQIKYLVVTSLKSNQPISHAQFSFSAVNWEKLNMPADEVNLELIREGVISSGPGSSLEGVLFNYSNYDFDTVEVLVILSDEAGSIIGANRTEIKTFLSKTERGFQFQWPLEQKGVYGTGFEIYTNLFENSNFIKSYGTQEKFQKFY